MYFTKPLLMQLEITKLCPFNCPQCYNKQRNIMSMDIFDVKQRINEAIKFGVRRIVLNGGEPLLYPRLEELIEYVSNLKVKIGIYSSGYMLNEKIINRLKQCHNIDINISLNGSSDEINSRSRQGFRFAFDAMQICCVNHGEYGIVFVCRHDNINDLQNLSKLGEKLGAKVLFLTINRPNGNGKIDSPLNYDDMLHIKNILNNHKGKIKIKIDTCFGMLGAFLGLPASIITGCAAGIYSYSINVYNQFRPCTHLDIAENCRSAEEYWSGSATLNAIREWDCSDTQGCSSCVYRKNCSPCYAIYGINNGNNICILSNRSHDFDFGTNND